MTPTMKILAPMCIALAACAAPSAPSAPSVPAAPSAAVLTPPSVPAAPANPAASAPPIASGAAAASAVPPGGADALVGQAAPDFTAAAHDGTTVHLAALKGKPVVLYFYPKDETAGCTKEACAFRDAWDKLGKTGAVLVGVSADTLDSHKAFVKHHKLPFLLISDPDGTIGRSYGVPFEQFHQRQTIVIGADGRVRKVYRKVDVGVHAQQILDDLSST
jgi:peroxiredoxin Q/BCP